MGTYGEQLAGTKLYNMTTTNINLYKGEMKDTDGEVLINEKMKDIYENIIYVLEDKKVYLEIGRAHV